MLDTDWAPDFVLDDVADRLIGAGVRSTWFVTHDTPVLAKLRDHSELFELGIHPNFLPGSTHGETPEAVLEHCMQLVPEAVSVRTHGLMQSTHLLDRIMACTPVKTDVSVYLPHVHHVQPFLLHWQGRSITRVPFGWEDDIEMQRPEPTWSALGWLAETRSAVLGFHPIHIYLNSSDSGPYDALKARFERLADATPEVAEEVRGHGPGSGHFFDVLMVALAGGGRFIRSYEIAEAP